MSCGCDLATFCLIGHTSTSSRVVSRGRVPVAPTAGIRHVRLGGMDDQPADRRRSALPWPDPVRSGPGRWTLLASALLVVALAAAALTIVIISM
jgi:hypothetical protein